MLLIIIGLAVTMTGFVASQISEQERTINHGNQSTSVAPNGKVKQVVYSLTYIPAGSKIEGKQIALQAANELDVYDDAEDSLSSVIGVVSPRSIPAHAQLRRVDLAPTLH